jgi:hypothetical protein
MAVTLRGVKVALCVLVLSGCVHRMSSDMNAWVGQDESTLVSKLGAPDRTADLPNGQKVLTYVTSYNGSQPGERVVMADCVRSFTVASAKIVSWSTRGCPGIVSGR